MEAAPALPSVDDARPHWRRDVVVFLTSQTVSLFGSMLVQYAILWHLTLATKSGLVLALAAVFGFLPQAIVSIFGGVWADRVNRKLLIVAADASIAVTTLALAIFLLSGIDDLWLIYATLAIRSVGAGIQMPAVSALIPQITPPAQLMRVNGITGAIHSTMALAAPAAAGVLYATASIVAIFFVDVVTAIVGITLLMTLTIPTIRDFSTQRPTYFADLVDGVRYVVRHAFVRWLLIVYAIVFVLIVAPVNLTPLMVVRSFGDEVWKLTATEVAFSLGMVLGSIIISVWGGTKNRIAMIAVSSLFFGMMSIALGLSTNLWMFLTFMLLFGLGVPFFSTTSMTLFQERVEPERQGRVFGFVGIVMAVAMPFGMVVFGPLADMFSLELLLIVTGIAVIVVITVAMLMPTPRSAMRPAMSSARTLCPLPDQAAEGWCRHRSGDRRP